MLSSPRSPAITIRTFSSAEYCRRVARRISRTAFSASSDCRSTFDLISAPSAVKMSQKPSLPQLPQTVQLVLTGNRYEEVRAGIALLESHETKLTKPLLLAFLAEGSLRLGNL